MRTQYSLIFFLSFLMFYSADTLAQFPGAGNRGGGQNMNMGHFYGKVVDSASNKGIDAASIQLIQNKLDTVTKKRKDVIVSGMLTTKKGEFSLENLPVMASYKLKITAIGYKPIERKIAFEINMQAAKGGDYSSLLNAVDKDLGNIKMETDAQQLQDVTVTSSKPLLTMSIDRKIFNVEKNITSTGGTAVDVMKNVPSVNVDIDGNVTLRNASPQIFVDGRPTTLTLDQIPADDIATVEIITNPSAKFDASGGGAGILNIVLKKNRKVGYNGNIRAGLDSRGKPSFGGDINVKQGKVNLFASGFVGFRKSKSTVSTERTDFLKGATANLLQKSAPVGTGAFGFGRVGMDYLLDNRNTITIAGNYNRGRFNNVDLLHINRDTTYGTYSSSDYGTRTTDGTFNFRNYGSSVSYKHNFAKPNKYITADANYNYSKNDNINNLSSQYFNLDQSPKTAMLNQRSQGGGNSKYFTAQTDYSDPINETTKLEAGARVAIRNFYSANDNFFQDPASGNFISLPSLNNKYQFKDQVLAAYATFSQQIKKFSYNVGLRVESSKYDGSLLTTAKSFSNKYPFSLFSSAFATYKLNDKQDVQLNYSRKINRPNFWQLIPFIDYTDSLNLSRGNPNLVPEFTNLLELAYQNQLSKGHNLLTTIYFKNTNDLIARFQEQILNPNPAKVDSVIISSYVNASKTYTYGIELISRDQITKAWDITSNFNLYQSTINAGNIPGGVNSNQVSWFGKLNNNFKLPKNYSIQLSGDYQSKTLIAGGGRGGDGGGRFGGGSQPSTQGYIKPFYGADIAIRKDFLKNNAASLTLQFSDIFRTRLNSTHSESAYFIQDYDRRRDPQVLRLNFNWRFGKIDASLFKRKNIKGEMENMQNNNQQGANGQ
ncbi:MAG: TonB-dependent receptor [Ferruginibacter sp.]|uniref:TonB-dependent receptor domain-containing protein n=1 Tax=Ferruginibacter sp. TaxID=1940288 RepID=UPI00265809C5|nr:TonB-dependent receptor [Ferruginibacter sp.]MDB5279438.1 TonB-dependent receptor [Ferruginibacter sp.]